MTRKLFKTFAEWMKKATNRKPKTVKIAHVVCRQDTQLRTKSSAAQIAAYRAKYQGNPKTTASGALLRDKKTKGFVYEPKADRMPPVILAPANDWTTDDPDSDPAPRFYCVDGDHRMTAAARAGLDEINAIILDPMTLDEAKFAAVGANADHGLARTNKDKQAALKVACELTDGLAARCKKKKNGMWGKVSYTGTLPNGEKVTARNLGEIAGVSHESAAQYLKTTYAAEFQNPTDDQDDDDEAEPSGNASDDTSGGADPVDEIRDLTSTEPDEYAHSLIAGASHDVQWIAAVAATLALWVDNQDEEAA